MKMAATASLDRIARRAGFSLLEVLVAMMVLSVGAASALSLFAAAVNAHRRAVDRTRAALVAERVVAAVETTLRSGVAVEQLAKVLPARLPPRLGDYGWEVRLDAPGASDPVGSRSGGSEPREWRPEELVVRVVVRWRRSGRSRSESFTTLLLAQGAAGESPGGVRRRHRLVRER